MNPVGRIDLGSPALRVLVRAPRLQNPLSLSIGPAFRREWQSIEQSENCCFALYTLYSRYNLAKLSEL